jgi:AraC-like DNA-binding protein
MIEIAPYAMPAADRFGSGYLAVARAKSQRIVYTPGVTHAPYQDGYGLNYLIEGRAICMQGDRRGELSATGLFLLDLALPSELELPGEFELATLVLPRQMLERHVTHPRGVCTVAVSGMQSGAARIAMSMLQSLVQNYSRVPAADADEMLEELVRSIALAYGALPACGGGETARSILLTRVRQYVLLHLQEEGASIRQMAEANGMAEADLSELLRQEGITLPRMIWMERLEEAHRMLAMGALADRSVKEIARACGFKDMSHFSSAFKARFGSGPREFRQARRSAV